MLRLLLKVVMTMADTRKETYVLKIKLGFADGDTRTINLDNPRNDLTAAEVHQVSEFIKNNNLLLGDKYGADSAGILYADIVESTKITLDI